MSPRNIDTSVAVAYGQPIVNIAWIVRLDIKDDPIFAWTGLGNLTFPSEAPDKALAGFTFEGLANIGEIGKIIDTMQGSQTVRLSLPGIKTDDEALQQVVTDQRQWQNRMGYIWTVPLTTGGALVGNPVRAKTGRMDGLAIEQRQDEGVVRIDLESFNAYSQRGIMTRYSEQREIDPSDTSQKYVHDLANKIAGIGDKLNATNAYTANLQDGVFRMVINSENARRQDAAYL